MKLVTDDTGGGNGNTDTDSMNNVFFQDETQFTRIYISGDAGHGKTALCKMLVLAWCQEHSGDKINQYIPIDFLTVMKKFDFLFYITLRNIRKNWIISEIIKKQYFNDSDFLNMFTKSECDKSSCLVILDGLDEWLPPDDYETPMHTTHGLPDLRHFERFTVLTTTRPWKLEVLRLGPQEMDRQVQLQGIDRKASDRYIKDMVDLLNKKKNIRKNSEDFQQQLEDKDLTHFLNIPILLKQLIMLWHHNEEEITGRSQVHVYSTMINHLLKDAWKRNKKKPLSAGNTQESELPLCLKEKQYCKIHKSLLLSLAQLAFTSAAKGELVFDHVEAELQTLTEGDINSCIKAGLLCQDIYTSPPDDEKKKLSFLHKSFQDFLAAVFLVMNPESAQLPQTCSTFHKILNMRSLFIFVSGLDSKVMTSLSHQVQNILEKDEKCKQHDSMLDLYRSVQIQYLLCECVEESKRSGQPLPYCHLKTVVIRERYFKNLQHLIRTNMSCIQNVSVKIRDPQNMDEIVKVLPHLTQLSSLYLQLLSDGEKESSRHLDLSNCSHLQKFTLKNCGITKVTINTTSLTYCNVSGTPVYFVSHSHVETMKLTLTSVEISDLHYLDEIVKFLPHVTQLSCDNLKFISDGEKESSGHLDLSHCSHLQKLILLNCDISKVTINTTSLTDCNVSGTPVYFVSHSHVETMKLTLESVEISDPHYLNEIVKFLPHVTQLSCYNLKFISDGEKESSRHLDFSHCSHLQEFSLLDCDITKVTINTTSLTDCYVSGTSVYFVSHSHVETMKLGLESVEISDPHYLDEIVKFLLHVTQLLCYNLKFISDGEKESSRHLDLSHCSHLQEFFILNCDISKVTINTTSLTDCNVFGTPVYFVSHSHVETMKLTLTSVEISDPHYLDEIVKFLPHVTQLSCYNLKFISDGEKESSCHLDLSNCSHLQKFTLKNCGITKVTINTTSLTGCYVSGTPVYFVSHPHVETMKLILILSEIRDPHYLNEFVKFLPHLTQLSFLMMKYLDFGDGDGDVYLFPKATHLKTVQLDSVTMTDRAMIKFLDSILTINHKVDCMIEGKLNEAVKTHITSRFVVIGKYLNNLCFHSQPAAH